MTLSPVQQRFDPMADTSQECPARGKWKRRDKVISNVRKKRLRSTRFNICSWESLVAPKKGLPHLPIPSEGGFHRDAEQCIEQ